MKKALLFFVLSLLVGIALAALYLFLVRRFTSSYDRDISMLFFPIPFLLGVWIFYSFAYNQKIIGILAIICTIAFFRFMMGILGVTFSKVYEGLTVPKVYKNYHYISDYRILHAEGTKYLVRLPEDLHHFVEGIYLNPQNELVIYDKSRPIDHDKPSVIDYMEKYNSLGERMQENDTIEIQQDIPNIFDGNSQRFSKKEETLKRTYINPLYVESYKRKGGEYETILYFDINTPPYTFRFKTKSSYIKNQKELLKTPTTYYTNDTETIESFGTISVYTNKHLRYQLLKIRDGFYEFYMIKE